MARTTSYAAQAVAKDVMDALRNGQKPNLQEIQLRHGYTKASAVTMAATKTQTYKRTMKPFLEQLKEKQSEVLNYLTPEKLNKATARDVVYCADLMTKNTQLLENKPTEISDNFTVFVNAVQAREYIDKALDRGKEKIVKR